jgi:hypothetical protein
MFGLPRAAFMQGVMPGDQPMPQQSSPFPERASPFIWGGGGRRMTPEQVAEEQARADAMMAAGADYSPVGSWAEGLARTSQGILGAFQAKRAGKAAEANTAESNSVMQALLAGSSGGKSAPRDAVIAAMMNPNVSKDVRGFAESEWGRMNPKAPAPTEFERMLANAGVTPGSAEYKALNLGAARNKGDPPINVTLPGGMFYTGPQSGLAAVMGGGGPASNGSGGLPQTLPPDHFDKQAPNMVNTPAPDLGANGMPQVISMQQYQAIAGQKGKAATDAMLARNNIQVR